MLKGQTFTFDKSRLAHNYIEAVAQQLPKNIAVVSGSEQIDYDTLNKRANQLAHYLITKKKIIPGDFIGIYFTPSIDLIITVLAIIKSGAAYVPLDLTYPEKLLNFIIQNSKPKIILTNLATDVLKNDLYNIHDLTLENTFTNPAIHLDAQNPLYVIYTSGSTGVPKGVLIPHRAAINHMLWMKNEFDFQQSDKVLLKTPLTFDPSVWEIFVPLFVGSQLVIAPAGSHIDISQLFNSIMQHHITTIQFVPTILDKFLNHPNISECSSLKRIFVGGETLKSKTKELFSNTLNCSLINLYGPSETTIDITYHIFNGTEEDINKNIIGKPIYNSELYIFNEHMSTCSTDEEGELYIAGESLGIGYLNNPEITKYSFISHPHIEDKIIYKTGDIVRTTEKGIIEYLYRRDKQIKINGVRVEIDALVSKILENNTVANCCIIKNDSEHDVYAYLICFLVPAHGNDIDITAIKNELALYFPKIVIPKEFFILDELPLLPNGKIDLKKLEHQSQTIKCKKINLTENKNEIREDLAHLCHHFLNAQLNNDFELDSLSCLILIEQIEKKFHIDLQVHEILSHNTIDFLTELILKKIKNIHYDSMHNNNTIVALKPSGKKTPIFLIHPIGGTVFWYNTISKHLEPDRPLYGIQDPAIESEDYLFDSIEEMAGYYLSRIKMIQPHGPYIIGGASFGATIAVEICRHLNKQHVQIIPILDGWAVYPDDLKDENYFRMSMLKQQNDWANKFGEFCQKEYKKLFSIQKHRLEMLFKYKMKPIDHDLVLFKSAEIMDIFKPIDSDDNNWSKYAAGKLDIIMVEGNHETMFHNHNAKNLAYKLSEILNSYKS